MNTGLALVIAWVLGGVLVGADENSLTVAHAPEQPRSGEKVEIKVSAAGPLKGATLEYQVVLPGNYIAQKDAAYKSGWIQVPMQGAGKNWSAEIPPKAQSHRTLVRYRITGQTSGGEDLAGPPVGDAQGNYAYFVYDGVPAWKGAIDPSSWDPRKNAVVEFPPDVMRQVQIYFLIARMKDVENATWYQQQQDKAYRYTGTLVANGKVYDHVQFRARGGAWRYAMGKNMWKFNFNKGHKLEAVDDYGQRYVSAWDKLNLRACIQQGDYGRRGEQGMYEAVGFRLFNLAGVDAPRTHWVSLRVVGEKEENPSNQYRGDFWGLYLAIENEDGDFLKEHGLPDGNVYKMMFGQGELSNYGKGAPANRSDLAQFQSGLVRRSSSEPWWRQNVDLPRYYSYRAIVEAIHHYDISDGKNYDFYFNPQSSKWCVIPWDIDLTWADHMYGGGRDPFYAAITRHAAIKVEYQNRLREIRDLLYNPEQTGRLIDECAAIVARPGRLSIVDADRMKWDYHPIMDSRYAMNGKAEKGLFYQAVRTRNFAGMVQQMKDYVNQRSEFIDRTLLADRTIPSTPVIQSVGAQVFRTSPYKGSAGFAAIEWRAGLAGAVDRKPNQRGEYEITPAWMSGEVTEFRDSMTLPKDALQPGKTYRVRCRVKDQAGKWSHWSDPVEFSAISVK